MKRRFKLLKHDSWTREDVILYIQELCYNNPQIISIEMALDMAIYSWTPPNSRTCFIILTFDPFEDQVNQDKLLAYVDEILNEFTLKCCRFSKDKNEKLPFM
jgi:hypothetical protein